jgi:hypothetical protein
VVGEALAGLSIREAGHKLHDNVAAGAHHESVEATESRPERAIAQCGVTTRPY